MMFDHPSVRVVRAGSGSFALQPERSDAELLRVSPADGGGFRVVGEGIAGGWILERDDGPTGGFRVLAGDGSDELGRSVGMGRLGVQREMRYVLLGDGALFRVVPSEPREGGFEVSGHETWGPYLTARLEPGGWRIAPTPACGGLEDLRILTLLFAAEILAAEEPNDPGQAVRA